MKLNTLLNPLRLLGFLLVGLSPLLSKAVSPPVSELVIYSSRKEQLLEPLLKNYTQKTGVTFKVLSDSEGPLVERLKTEGTKSPADIFIAVDAGNLWNASHQDLLSAIDSKILDQSVPAALQSPKHDWFAVTKRVRTAVYNPKSVKATDIVSFEDFADPKWKGKLCLRSSKKVYNQSLVAMMIKRLGEKETEKVLKGWVANLATAPFADDTALIKAVEAGQCGVGIVNHYYFSRYLKENAKSQVKLAWVNQNSSGVHVNISGAGVTKNSKHKKQAQEFLEWLVSPEAQTLFAQINTEYPVVSTKVELPEELKKWGTFKEDQEQLSFAGELQRDAVKLMDKVGYN